MLNSGTRTAECGLCYESMKAEAYIYIKGP